MAWSLSKVQLFEPLVFLLLLLLVADVRPDGVLVTTDRVDEKAPGPKVLPDEIPLSLSINPRQVDGALALYLADDLRHQIFRRNRQQHMHVIGIRCPCFCSASLR